MGVGQGRPHTGLAVRPCMQAGLDSMALHAISILLIFAHVSSASKSLHC